MDLNNYWQENKRFVAGVGVGVALFAVAWYAIDSYLGADLRAQRSALTKVDSELAEPVHSAADLEHARADNQTLVEACTQLRKRVEFVPRPEFRMEKGVPATNRYFSVFENVREDLHTRANHAGVTIPEDLGMPSVGPSKEILLARYLEALDAIEQATRTGIDSGVARLSAIRVKLEPRLLSGKPFDDMERTTIEMEWLGDPQAIGHFLVALQEPREGRALLVDNAIVEPARAKSSEVGLQLTLLVAHLNRVGATDQVAEADKSDKPDKNAKPAASQPAQATGRTTKKPK